VGPLFGKPKLQFILNEVNGSEVDGPPQEAGAFQPRRKTGHSRGLQPLKKLFAFSTYVMR
jgi:hypothetical protein